MAVGETFKLNVKFREIGTSNELINSLAFKQLNPLILDEEGEDLVQAYKDNVGFPYRELISDKYELTGWTVEKLPGNALVYEEVASPPPTGLVTGDSLPPQTAAIVTWRTGTPGRSFRGRTFLLPTGESNNDGNGRPSGQYRIDVADKFVQGLLDMNDTLSITTAAWELGVWSSKLSQFTPVTSHTVREFWGNQRSRRV